MRDFIYKGLALSILVVILGQLKAFAQTSSQNFVMSRSTRVSGITTATQLSTASTDKTQVQTTIQYLDGLGRPVQTIQRQGSPLGYDMIQPQAYDSYGRETTKYEPYTLPSSATSNGSYRTDALTTGSGQASFYTSPPTGVSSNTSPYSLSVIEPSPLNRPLEQGAPGNAWQPYSSSISTSGHTTKMDYLINDNNTRQAALYTASINSDGSRSLARANNTATYDAGQLTVNVMKDENWTSGQLGTTETYTDKESHVVLKRTFNNNNGTIQALSTYYVYDDKEELAFVLPPGATPDATNAISQTTLDNLCYQYQYDERNRLSQKKIPGKGWEYMVYNILDQVVATQNANQRINNQWIMAKYDGQGRPVISGIWDNGNTAISRATLQSTITAITTNLWESQVTTGNGYTANAWPASWTTTLSINYYDDYTLIPGLPATYSGPTGYSQMTRGLLLATKTAVLNNPSDMLWIVHYYDDLGRNKQSYQQHYLRGSAYLNTGNYDVISSTYDFTNVVTTTTRKHYVSGTLSITIGNQYIYDHMGRKLKNWEQITNGTNSPTTRTLLSKTDYNELGQVMTKHLHNQGDSITFYQNVNYAYNERGWMLSSIAGLFQEYLQYNSVNNISSISPTAQYNGNIASQSWGTQSSPNTNSSVYSYDNLNRLIAANSTNGNSENGISYDVMGNITGLSRYRSGTQIDALSYTYNSTNQLQSITDGTTNDQGLQHGTWSYGYDGNGNQITDPSKGSSGIMIAYNLHNLPQTISGSKTITYIYDANGQKLRRVSMGTGSTDYISGIQYDDNGTGNAPTISFIQTDEGRALYTGSNYNYEYNLQDHLGNSRVSFDTQSGSANQVQSDEYYAFGMDINNSQTSPKNEYLYNKKELQEELGQYDYGARFYDPVIARWTTIDPLAEKFRRWSTYNYADDNPVRFIDPDGMGTTDPKKPKPPEKEVTYTFVITLGAQGKAELKTAFGKLGIDVNAASFDVIGVRDNKFVFMEGKRQSIGGSIGIVGAKAERSFTEKPAGEDKVERTTTTTTGWSVLNRSSSTEKVEKSIVDYGTGETKTQVISEKHVDKSSWGFSFAAIIGLEATRDNTYKYEKEKPKK